jgi:hypothetical protein
MFYIDSTFVNTNIANKSSSRRLSVHITWRLLAGLGGLAEVVLLIVALRPRLRSCSGGLAYGLACGLAALLAGPCSPDLI